MADGVQRLARTYREKGALEIARRSIWRALDGSASILARGASRFAPDHNRSLTREERALRGRNSVFKNSHKGERCFVLGNGPSLGREDLRPLADEKTFVVNTFFENPIVGSWQPTYYCLSDPACFEGSKAMNEYMCNLRSRVPDSTFFVPIFADPVIRERRLLPLERTYYVNFRGELQDEPLSGLDLTQDIPGVWNVAELCIMVAMYMGFTDIYLLGLDHDWLANRREYSGWGESSYRFIMEYQLKIWQGYEHLRGYAEQKGITIRNATRGSYLDLFEEVDYRLLIPAWKPTPQADRLKSSSLEHPASAGVR